MLSCHVYAPQGSTGGLRTTTSSLHQYGWRETRVASPMLLFCGKTTDKQRPSCQPGIAWMSHSWNHSQNDSPCTWFVKHFKINHNLFPGATNEVMRFDRDSHVEILFDNMKSGFEHNFNIKDESLYTTSNTSFDASSIMMFGPTDFGLLDSSGERKTVIQSLIPGVEIRWQNIFMFC